MKALLTNKYRTIKQIAEALGICRLTAYRRVKKAVLADAMDGGRWNKRRVQVRHVREGKSGPMSKAYAARYVRNG